MNDLSENMIFNFYFLNVDISLIIHATNFIFSIQLGDITDEGTVSQIFDMSSSSICRKYRNFRKITK